MWVHRQTNQHTVIPTQPHQVNEIANLTNNIAQQAVAVLEFLYRHHCQINKSIYRGHDGLDLLDDQHLHHQHQIINQGFVAEKI